MPQKCVFLLKTKKKSNLMPLQFWTNSARSASRNLGAFSVITSFADAHCSSVLVMSSMTEGPDQTCLVHATKRGALVQTLPVKVWSENFIGAILPCSFYSTVSSLLQLGQKRIKLADNIVLCHLKLWLNNHAWSRLSFFPGGLSSSVLLKVTEPWYAVGLRSCFSQRCLQAVRLC